MDKILLGIGIIILLLGIRMIYDARPLVRTYFSFGNENEAVLGMKIMGFLFSIIGGILVYFNF